MSESKTTGQEGPVSGVFTADEERLHEAGFSAIGAGLSAGKSFEEACAAVEATGDLKRIVVDDYLKVTIAQRHFQGGESLPGIAEHLRAPLGLVEAAYQEMLREVAAASVDVFRRQGGEFPES